jgi:hypothetical protein
MAPTATGSQVTTLRRAAFAALAGLSLCASPLSAQPSEQRVALSYEAPSRCGGRDDLIARIERRSPRIVFAALNETHRVDVVITAQQRFRANVKIAEANDGSERSFDALSCDELLDAVALVIVVTLDPSGVVDSDPVTPKPAGDTESQQPPGAEDPAALSPSEGTARKPTTAAKEPPQDPRSDDWEQSVDAPDLPSSLQLSALLPERWGVGVGGRVLSGPAPKLLVGVELGVEFLWNPRSVLSPRLALAVNRSWSGRVVASGGHALFTLDQFLLEFCPVRLGAERWDLRPCLGGTAGAITAEGSNTVDARRVTRPWGTFGVGLRASARPLEALELWAAAGIAAAIIRDQFQFEPSVFHEVPEEVLTGTLGFSALFP